MVRWFCVLSLLCLAVWAHGEGATPPTMGGESAPAEPTERVALPMEGVDYNDPSYGKPLERAEQDRFISGLEGRKQQRDATRTEILAREKEGANIYPLLLRMVATERFTLVWEVVNIIGTTQDARGLPILLEQVTRRHPDEKNDHHVRWRSTWAIASVGGAHPDIDIAAQLRRLLKCSDPQRPYRVAIALACLHDPAALPYLEPALRSADEFTRWEALYAMRNVHDHRTIELIRPLLKDRAKRVASEAQKLIDLIQSESAPVTVPEKPGPPGSKTPEGTEAPEKDPAPEVEQPPEKP